MIVPISAKENQQSYVVTVYNEKNGLPTGEANTVLQTSDGYIWIGSYGGLIRYDGTDFRNYSVEGAISTSSIRSLFEDSQGRLWIGTNDAGVFVMEEDQFIQIEMPSDRSFLCIRDFAEGSEGQIYVASNSGVGEIKDHTLIAYQIDHVLGNTAYSVAKDTYGRIWAAMNSGQCAIIQDGQLLDMFDANQILKNTNIYCSAADSKGNIILGTSTNEIITLRFSSEQLNKNGYTISHLQTGNVYTHNKIQVSQDNDMMVCGLQGFALIDTDGHITEFDEKDKAMSVNAAITDYENNLWLATSSYGIIKYTQGCFDTPNETAQLEDVTVNTVAVGQEIYIGTDTGLIVCNTKWQRISHQLTNMYNGVRIRHIIIDSQGKVWIASYSDNAVVCYDPSKQTIKKFNTENGLAGNNVRVLQELSNGCIAVGTQTGLSIIKNNQVIKTYDHQDGIDNCSILCINEGDNGTLLVGSDGNGIYEINDNSILHHSFDEGLNEGVVLRMLKDTDNDNYFISAGSSLYYWKDGEFSKLDNFNKSAGSIFDFYDRDGTLWLMQNNGIYAVNKELLLKGEEVDTVEYSFSHGLTGSLNANTWNWLTDDGMLYMSTRSGISEFSFKGVNNNFPKAIINQVNVDDTIYEHPDSLKVDSHANRITIHFSVLSYTDTTNLRIAYQLEGFDDKEMILDNDKSGNISYTNLSGGNYHFTLRIYDPDNPENEQVIDLEIMKSKRLVEQPLFWLGMIILLIAVGVGTTISITRMKMSRLHHRQQKYKQIVEDSLTCFAKTIDAKDKYTNGHSTRVAQYSRELAKRMGMSEQEQEHIYYTALLHDIGKIGIPDYLLQKPGKLTDEERNIMQRHPAIGGEILKDYTAIEGIAEGAKYHHERYDGQGYCEGLAGENIPLVARIIAVADAYDAMSSDRCYRKALTTDVIIKELQESKGTQLDPEIVSHMLDMIEEGIVPFKDE